MVAGRCALWTEVVKTTGLTTEVARLSVAKSTGLNEVKAARLMRQSYRGSQTKRSEVS